MDRLTKHTGHGIYLDGSLINSTGYTPDCVLEKLAAYEDTSLTPEQVQEMATAQRWIPVSERLPEAEERVLVLAETRCTDGKTYKHITTGMHEDGTVWREESDWNFNDLDNCEAYDEERGDWKIPEGWWEYTIYNDDEGNYLIDDFVTHWMPLPKPPKEENNEND